MPRTWLGKLIPYAGFLEEQIEELRVANQKLTDQLLRVTGNEPIYEQRPALNHDGSGPVKTRQTMDEYLRRLEAEERELFQPACRRQG